MKISNEELRRLDGEQFWEKYGAAIMLELRGQVHVEGPGVLHVGSDRTNGVMERLATVPNPKREE